MFCNWLGRNLVHHFYVHLRLVADSDHENGNILAVKLLCCFKNSLKFVVKKIDFGWLSGQLVVLLNLAKGGRAKRSKNAKRSFASKIKIEKLYNLNF